MLKWMRRGLRLGLLLLFLLSAALLWVRIAPPSLGFLAPAVERALARTLPGIDTRIEDIRLDWPLGSLDPAIRIDRVQVRGGDGSLLAASPAVGMNLRLSSLIRGEIEPSRITLHRPILDLSHRNTVEKTTDETGGNLGGRSDEDGRSEKIPDRIVSLLRKSLIRLRSGISLYDGRCSLSLEDAVLLLGEGMQGVKIQIEAGDVETSDKGVQVTALGWVEWASEETRFSGNLRLPKQGAAAGEIEFFRLMPNAVADFIPAISDMQGADLPFDGRIRADFDADDRFNGAEFHLSNTGGTVNHILLDTPISVGSIEAAGRIGKDLSALALDSLFIKAGGVELAASGGIGWKNGPLDTDLKAAITGITFDLLPDLWPAALARKVRKWFFAHFQGGIAEKVDLRLRLTPEDFKREHPRPESLRAVVDFKEVILDYEPPLPALKNGAGQAVFDADSVKIRIRRGTLARTHLQPGAVVEITRFTAKLSPIVILGNLEGPAEDLGDLGKTLEKGKSFPVSVISGSARTRLGLRFPIWKGLEPEDVVAGIDAASEIRGISLSNPFDASLTDGAFTAKIADARLAAEGTIVGDGLPMRIRWERDLLVHTPHRIALRTAVTTDFLARKGISVPFVNGLLGVDAAIQMENSRASVVGTVDLEAAAVDMGPMGLKKPLGQNATLRLDLLAAESVIRFSNLELSAPGIGLKGTATLDTNAGLLTAALYRVRFGKNDLNLDIRWQKDGESRIDLSGNFFDAAPLMAWGGRGKASPSSSSSPSGSGLPAFPVRLVMDLNRVGLKNGRGVNRVMGQLIWPGQGTPVGVLEGSIGEDGRVRIELAREAGIYQFDLNAQNAGALLEAVGISSYIRGGRLHVEVHPHDPLAFVPPFEGKIRMKDFTVTDAPEVMGLLSLASFDGIVEQLNRRGIPFDDLDAELLYADGRVLIDRGRMEGNALGVTVKGEIDLPGRTLDLSGIIVPFNTVNRLIGTIPLLGKLITGDGIIAANYTLRGPCGDPQVRVDPLSTLLVGSLRKLFRGVE